MGQIRLVPPTLPCISEEREKFGIGMGNESIFAQSIALNNKSLKNKVKEKEPMMRTTEDNYS